MTATQPTTPRAAQRRRDDPTAAAEPTVDRIRQVLEAIRPSIRSDGGDIEFVSFDEQGVVTIRLHGACVGCPSSHMTLKLGIEDNLKANVPDVTRVVAADNA